MQTYLKSIIWIVIVAGYIWLLVGCQRHYYLYICGEGHTVEVTVNASVPKTTDVSPELDLNFVP